ncbi:putative amidophosphoribosyltransferase [Kibdelosporangium banguiense]|uniref:Amidophosphoribosyltransferase n=1 Tax=Kibdelosporangium banguiense TaxID=1365924 RepID=A0ABS4TEM3_9PSEU|nr:phosphoribosyltransferase family protein [Kibdelosporangium banguiense]MBP2322878.1 putative amidophosphoribosyltransferase [Kibdelosporangium banguiense]
MLRGLLELLVPACCAGCGEPGTVLCLRCHRTMSEPQLVTRSPGPPMYALGAYEGAARRAVIAYKERGRRELAEYFGRLLAEALRVLPEADVVPAPSRRAAVRKRGFHHMELIASHTGAVVRPVLRLDRGAKDSVGLDPAGRAANLAGRLSCAAVRGARVILVDDVITTGATAAACCSALHQAGAEVTAVVALTAT